MQRLYHKVGQNLDMAKIERTPVWYGPVLANEGPLFQIKPEVTIVDNQPFELSAYGTPSNSFRLDLQTTQSDLFTSFIKITSCKDAQSWWEENGFPGAVWKDPEERKFVTEYAAMIEAASASIKTLQKFNNAINMSDDYVVHDMLEELLIEYSSAESDTICGVGFKGLENVFVSNGTQLDLVSLEHLTVRKSVFKRQRKKSILRCARETLQRSLNIMLRGVDVTLEWHQLTNGRWTLKQEISVACPWHAVVSEFVRRICGKILEPRLCKCPDCKAPIDQLRRHAMTCQSERCRKWYQRNKHSLG